MIFPEDRTFLLLVDFCLSLCRDTIVDCCGGLKDVLRSIVEKWVCDFILMEEDISGIFAKSLGIPPCRFFRKYPHIFS